MFNRENAYKPFRTSLLVEVVLVVAAFHTSLLVEVVFILRLYFFIVSGKKEMFYLMTHSTI